MDSGYAEMIHQVDILEYRINQYYRQAERELQEKINKYYKDFDRLDQKKKELVNSGKLSEADYKTWRHNKMMTGRVWEQRKDVISRDLYNTNYKARNMVYDELPDVYASAHNFATYQIENGAHVDTSYTLYNKEAVERLIADNPDLLPYQKLNMAKDMSWNKKNIQAVMIQGILQGESIPHLAKRLSKTVVQKNRAYAIRNARTMATAAYNGGKMDAFKRAKALGVDMKVRWRATFDDRTRDSHRRLDGEVVEVGQPFSNGLTFPCDMSWLNGAGYGLNAKVVDVFKEKCAETYNCRCTIQGVVKGLEPRAEKYRVGKIHGLTYEDWKKGKNVPQIRPKAQPKHKIEKKPKNNVEFTDYLGKHDAIIKELCTKVMEEYNSPLNKVIKSGRVTNKQGLEGGHVSTGMRSVLALTIPKPSIFLHEFAHTLAIRQEDKLGFADNKAFWKEIQKVRTAYHKDTSWNQHKIISNYASTDIDEFMAEAFTLSKCVKYGIPIPDGMRADGVEWADKVVEIIDKYFKKRK